MQPPVHRYVDQRTRNEASDEYDLHEVPREQQHDAVNGCAEHLPYADLLGPTLGRKQGQAVKTQTGNQNGKNGKVVGERSNHDLALIHLLELVIQKMILERVFRIERLVDLFEVSNRFGRLTGGHTNEESVGEIGSGSKPKNDGLNGRVHIRDVKISYHPHDLAVVTPHLETLPDRILHAHGRDRRFIDDVVGRVRSELHREKSSVSEFDPRRFDEIVIGIDDEEAYSVIGIFALPRCAPRRHICTQGILTRRCHTHDSRLPKELLFERGKLVLSIPFKVHVQKILTVDAEVFGPDVTHLLGNRHGRNNQDYGHDELEDDEPLPKP